LMKREKTSKTLPRRLRTGAISKAICAMAEPRISVPEKQNRH
jgi:hypothetical protein